MAASLKPHFTRVDSTAADGPELPRGVYQHIIVDHASAGERGFESVARLAGTDGQEAVITLLTSNPLDAEEYALWVRHGVRQVLQRPLSFETLLHALREAHESATHERGLPSARNEVPSAAAA